MSQSFRNTNIQFVKQYIPKEREKPLGTSDAVVQALDQFPDLKKIFLLYVMGIIFIQ